MYKSSQTTSVAAHMEHSIVQRNVWSCSLIKRSHNLCFRPPVHSRHCGELPQRHPGDRHQQDRAEHQVRARLLPPGQRHARGQPRDPGQQRPPAQHPGEGGPHRPVHHPDQVRLSCESSLSAPPHADTDRTFGLLELHTITD